MTLIDVRDVISCPHHTRIFLCTLTLTLSSRFAHLILTVVCTAQTLHARMDMAIFTRERETGKEATIESAQLCAVVPSVTPTSTQAPRANGYDDSYAGKRDRWNGYDPNEFKRVLKKHEMVTKERQAIREAQVDESLQSGHNKQKQKKNESGMHLIVPSCASAAFCVVEPYQTRRLCLIQTSRGRRRTCPLQSADRNSDDWSVPNAIVIVIGHRQGSVRQKVHSTNFCTTGSSPHDLLYNRKKAA